jgi:hypothetical protein
MQYLPECTVALDGCAERSQERFKHGRYGVAGIARRHRPCFVRCVRRKIESNRAIGMFERAAGYIMKSKVNQLPSDRFGFSSVRALARALLHELTRKS